MQCLNICCLNIVIVINNNNNNCDNNNNSNNNNNNNNNNHKKRNYVLLSQTNEFVTLPDRRTDCTGWRGVTLGAASWWNAVWDGMMLCRVFFFGNWNKRCIQFWKVGVRQENWESNIECIIRWKRNRLPVPAYIRRDAEMEQYIIFWIFWTMWQ